MTDQYGHEPIHVGVGWTLDGVTLYVKNPITGDVMPVLRVAPEFARHIAQSMTLASFDCEDERRKYPGG